MKQGKPKTPHAAIEARPSGPAGAACYFANKSSPEDKQAAARVRRGQGYEARAWLWAHSSLRRAQECGRFPLPNEEAVTLVKGADGRAFLRGLMTCGSSSVCPVCAAKVRAARAVEVEQALGRWRKSGGDVLFVTFTMRHHSGQKLSDLWAGLSYAWGRVTSGKGWKEAKEAHGVAGYVRVVEATHGDNGWHLHIHAAMPTTHTLTLDEQKALETTLFERWKGGLAKHGLTAWKGPGVDIRRTYSDSGLGRYMAKAAAELTRGDVKEGKGRTPFRILFDLADGVGTQKDARLWAEWEKVSRGKRFISWSRNLRDLVGEVASDEELAAAEETGEAEVVAVFTHTGWRQLLARGGVQSVVRLLDLVETSGPAAARIALDKWGIRWGPPPKPRAAA